MNSKWKIHPSLIAFHGIPRVFTHQPKIPITDHQHNKLEELKEFKDFFEHIDTDKTTKA